MAIQITTFCFTNAILFHVICGTKIYQTLSARHVLVNNSMLWKLHSSLENNIGLKC